MTGKEAILCYLKTHECFSVSDVVVEFGSTKGKIGSAALTMLRKGELTSIKRRDGSVTYFSLDAEKGDFSVIEQCKRSPTMTRVLVVWGALPVDALR